ncbi:hypothetical protein KDL29_03390 [bacterium]|nr:hypothetical protein [bacterium]
MLAGFLLLAACGGNGGQRAQLAATPQGSGSASLEALQTLLDSELLRLGIDTSHEASIAPSAGNAVFDLQASMATVVEAEQAEVTLRWTERLVGDYDQNGLVNAADLVPLAQHFGESVSYRSTLETDGIEGWTAGLAYDPADAANWRRARIDGNMDGEINAGDVTPIAQHWQQSLAGYRVYRMFGEQPAQLLGNPQDAESVLSVERSAALQDDKSQPVAYSFTDTITSVGGYTYYVAAYDPDSDDEGPPSRPVHPQFNIPPTALLAANQTSGAAPLLVSFDASGSNDPDGRIVRFDFDLDGDGLFEKSGTDEDAVAEYGGGSHTARLRVTDDNGATDTASLQLMVSDQIVPVITPDHLEDSLPASFVLSADDSVLANPLASCEWFVGLAGEPAQSTPELQDFSIDYTSTGDKLVRLRLTDTNGVSWESQQQLKVWAAPQAVITGGDTGFWKDSTAQFSASASSGRGLVFLWDLDAGWMLNADYENFDVDFSSMDISFPCKAKDVFSLTLRVRDQFGKLAETSGQYPVYNIPGAFIQPGEPYYDQGNAFYEAQPGQLQLFFSGDWEDTVTGWTLEFPDGNLPTLTSAAAENGALVDIYWKEPGGQTVRLSLAQNVSEQAPAAMTTEINVPVKAFSPVISIDNPNHTVGEIFEFDNSASVSDITLAGFSWDFDSDGITDYEGLDSTVS